MGEVPRVLSEKRWNTMAMSLAILNTLALVGLKATRKKGTRKLRSVMLCATRRLHMEAEWVMNSEKSSLSERLS